MVEQKPTIIYENTVVGVFVRRINRFTAEVLIDGEPEIVHVKNTGRLQELLLPKAKVTLQKKLNANRKTAYDLISVYKPGLKWVNIDSLAPNMLMKQQLMSLNYDLVKPEYTYGKSRIDFYMESNGERFLTEVKGCTLADDLYRIVSGCTDGARREALTGTDKGGKRRLPLLNCFCDSDEWYSSRAAKRDGATGI